MNINAAYYSSAGNRAVNEDSIILMEDLSGVIAIVADGLGGEGNGDAASRIAVKTISSRLAGSEASKEIVSEAMIHANEEIINLQKNGNRMKSTAAVLFISGTCAFAAHVGDTRIYQLRKDRVIYQSIDHSVSQMSVNAGEITLDEIRRHSDRNKLTNALGSRNFAKADLIELNSQNGDAYLLCSDGFWEYVLEDEMREDLSTSNNSAEWLRRMRGRVESRISQTGDNHSAITIIIESL